MIGVLLALLAAPRTLPCARQEEPLPISAAPLARAADLSDSGLAFVELGAERSSYVVGEPLELRLRIGLERAFLEEGLVQLFQQRLDLPVQVSAPAMEGLEGLRFEPPQAEPALAEGASFALGERIVRARRLPDETRAGRTYAVFELARRALPVRAGTLALGTPVLSLARATRFEDDFLRGRVPLDREDGLVRGAAASLVILPPPEAGRPAEFSGAVGRFRVTATAVPQDLVLGASLELTLRIEAEDGGALAPGIEPRLEDMAGFHVLGRLAEGDERGLSARYQLAPEREGVYELPPLRFAYYDPAPPAGYRTLETAPIPLVVRAPAPGATPDAPPEAPTAPEPPAPRGFAMLLGGVAVLAVLALALRALRRRAR
jgi:oxygen tolerance protein BatD